MEKLLTRASSTMSMTMITASSFPPGISPRAKLFVQQNHPSPKIFGSRKQDHWILDKKNKQLIRVHITPRKALFTPNGAKECPINPDHISRERTTEIIDASAGGDPDILEDNWRLTSQANKPMINLWTGKTIFTFADNSGSAADRIIDKRGWSTIEPDPFAPSSEEPTSLPLALGRMHKRLSIPEELKKLHLQHHHMTTDQFRFRTRALHLPKSTFDLFDKIRSECEVCQAAKHAPSRSKTSGLRADTFGDMTFIDPCQVPLGTGEHIILFVILDGGATTLLAAEAVTATQEAENITFLRNYFDQYHLQPKSVVADQAFMTDTWEHFYQSLDITPISLGPNSPWVFWLKARFNDYWQPTLQGEGPHTEKQYMDFIKKVYSICCYTNAQSEVYGTDIIPMVCHNGNIDLEKTVQNVEQVCRYFRMDPSKAKQITDLILWRIERMSRSFSGCLRHDPRHGIHKECRRHPSSSMTH